MGKQSSKKFSTHNETPENAKKLSKKKFHTHDLVSFSPLNERQKSFFEAFYSQTPIILQDGPAGTGKTAVAIYCALSEVFDPAKPQSKLIIARPAVDTVEQGFVPGDQDEKDSVYEEAYYSLINGMIKYDDSYNNLKAAKYYEFRTTGRLRGLTFNDTIVIIDEFQNCSYHELRTIITRLGYNSKIILCGDIKQCDLSKKRGKSGLDNLKKVLLNMPVDDTAMIEYRLEDIVRSGIVKEFLIADHKYSNI